MGRNNSDENPEQHSKNKWRNHKPSKVTKAIAGLIIYLLFVFIDAHEIWPSWPLLAVIGGVIASIAVLYLEAFAIEAISFDKFLIGSAVVTVLGGLIYLFAARNEPIAAPTLATPTPPAQTQIVVVPVPTPTPAPTPPPPAAPRTFEGGPGIPFEDMEVRGALKPANEPTPPNGCSGYSDVAPQMLKVLIGSNTIVYDRYDKFTAIRVRSCDAVSIDRSGHDILVDASLYGPNGEPIATIKSNRITALNGEHYTARQSYDESTVTVKNAAGLELFYVRFLNPTTIRIRGYFGCHNGPTVRVTDNQISGITMFGSCFGPPAPAALSGFAGFQVGPP
jgi:hypothetical protein